MSWLKKLKKWDERPTPQPATVTHPKEESPETICCDVFKSHWRQICDIISVTNPRPVYVATTQTVVPKIENITHDDINAIQNLLQQMIYLLVEEQSTGQLLGPVLEYAITQNVFQKLLDWWESTQSYKAEIMLSLLKVYEVLISQAQHSLLHHKQLVAPMLKLLSSNSCTRSEELDGHIVLLLNLLCVWMNRDPTLLEVFFNASSSHGSANFLIFSLLIDFIHREGTVGQQARDALLLCMSLSSENESVANYIVQQSNFCPVLATGLSALYSTLPRHMVVRADDWHCLHRSDWSQVPSLTNFMNSFEFCNSVIEVAHSVVGEQLLEFFYNGFLISVFSPSLHKTSADEVVVTTAYLNLFLRSVTAPSLMRCFLHFLLTHRHESSLIINTLILRIASNNRLALVSLSLIRTLADLNCEDLMLQLVFRHLIPCEHLLLSQRRAICDVDLHNASAARFLALTPVACRNEVDRKAEGENMFRPVEDEPGAENRATRSPTLQNESRLERVLSQSPSPPAKPPGNGFFSSLRSPSSPHETSFFRGNKSPSIDANHAFSEYTVNEDLSVTISMHSAVSSDEPDTPGVRLRTITSPSTMAEFGPDLESQLQLNTSYMDYLEDARSVIDQCREACEGWSAPYDGVNPPPEQIENKNDPISRSTPLVHRKSEDNTAVDQITTQTPDSAMKALSATLQTLDITALAMNGHAPLPLSPVATNADPKPSSEEGNTVNTPLNDVDIADEQFIHGNEVKESGMKTEGDVATDLELPLEVNSVEGQVKDVESEELLSPVTEKLAKPHSGSIGQTSSVDDFFRSLMDIVPKSTREKVESGKLPKQSSNAVNPDEDIESGIEVSSDDVQNNSPERNLNDGECGETELQQNEDTMSQVSVNTADMDDEDPMKMLASRQNEEETHVLNDDDLSYNRSQNYSFAEETDDEFDDSASIASSSFYEPADDYVPTELSVAPAVPLKLQGVPYTGPLMGTLFAKLDQMINNSLYENLLLTGIVTRLACYPHPLLRSFLLNTQMVFHPSVRSLYQVLNSARNKIDTYSVQVSDFKVLVRRAQKYLLARGTIPLSGDARTRNNVHDRPMPVPKVKSRTFGDMFMRRKPNNKKKSSTLLPRLETLLERRGRTKSKESNGSVDAPQEIAVQQSASQFYIKQSMRQREREERKLRELRTKNAVYASIVLSEFLKELAAVAQEHAVAHFA